MSCACRVNLRPPLLLLYAGVTVAFVVATAVPLWQIPYNAGRTSIDRVSQRFRAELLRTTVAQLASRLIPIETLTASAANSARLWPDLQSAGNFSDEFLTEFPRAGILGVVEGSSIIVSAGIARLVLHPAGYIHISESIHLAFFGFLSRVYMPDGVTIIVHSYDPRLPLSSYSPQTGLVGTTLPRNYTVRDGNCDPIAQPYSLATIKTAGACPYPLWDEDIVFGKGNVPVLFLNLPILSHDGNVLSLVSVACVAHSLAEVLRASAQSDQRMFLTLRRPDGRLVASSHGKFWSHSDQDTGQSLFYEVATSFYTPEECTDPIIRAAAPVLRAQNGGTWLVDFVDTTVSPYGKGEWLALSAQLGTRPLQVWLLQDSETEFGQVRRAQHTALVVFAALLPVAVIVGGTAAALTARPIPRLARQLLRVGEMDFDSRPQARSRSVIREVAVLQRSFDTLLISVQSFTKYVPIGVVKSILRSGTFPKLEVLPVEGVAVMFADIVSFTQISGALDPADVALLLEIVLGELSTCITGQGGTIDKYIGDCVMALWGCCDATTFGGGEDRTAPACMACRAAVNMLAAIDSTIKARLEQMLLPAVDVRIGVHTGMCLVGNVGNSSRFNYTAVGDAVNTASRLEALNKQFGTRAMVSKQVVRLCPPELGFRSLGKVKLIGATKPLGVAELVGPALFGSSGAAKLWEDALVEWTAGNFSRAAALFLHSGNSGPAAYFHARATKLAALGEWPGFEVQLAK